MEMEGWDPTTLFAPSQLWEKLDYLCIELVKAVQSTQLETRLVVCSLNIGIHRLLSPVLR
jgi:hypothetical protein